jgi:ribosomal protein L11 methylase PrmA
MRKHQLLGLVQSLYSTVKKLSWEPQQTDWAQYESFHTYSSRAMQHKKEIVAQYMDQSHPSLVWDLGANTGEFSRLASQQEIHTVAFDLDPGAVELSYLRSVDRGDRFLLPLVLDLSNPSPSLGWALEERNSLIERGPADAILALALIHHLAIGNNVPFAELASFFGQIGQWLIIEFVPKEDPQVRKLLQVREDIFTDYTRDKFIQEFSTKFDLIAQQQLDDSQRVMFLFKKKDIL